MGIHNVHPGAYLCVVGVITCVQGSHSLVKGFRVFVLGTLWSLSGVYARSNAVV